MTRLLVAYDGSASARAAIAAAGTLFPAAEAVVATVSAPFPEPEASALTRIALPEAALREISLRLHVETAQRTRGTAAEGTALARGAGLNASATVLEDTTPWRALRLHASSLHADVLVCGTRGEGPVDRVLLGSTASSLVHHAEIPLLVVPAGAMSFDGPVLAGWDGSDGAREALGFAAAHLRSRPLVVAHAWRSPVRHSIRGHVFVHAPIEKLRVYADGIDGVYTEEAEQAALEGLACAHELGLESEAATPESGLGDWQTLLAEARRRQAAAILVGSRGRGAVAATVLGSVTSGLVHAAALPVLVVPLLGPSEEA